jgi:hypothetical protein
MAPQSSPLWPTETNIVFVTGMNRVILTLQHPLLHAVIQEGFEILRASLLFDHAFPDGNMILSVVKDSLVAAAKYHLPRAGNIYECLMADDGYAAKIWPLVSFSIIIYDMADNILSCMCVPPTFKGK